MRRKRSMAALKREALKAWGAAILKRDPTCRVCKRAPSRNPHHLFPKSRYRHLWFDLRNGAGLCTSCHYRIHFDPIVPVLKIVDEMGGTYGHLELDAAMGRRKNPYKRGEYENILVALKEQAEVKYRPTMPQIRTHCRAQCAIGTITVSHYPAINRGASQKCKCAKTLMGESGKNA